MKRKILVIILNAVLAIPLMSGSCAAAAATPGLSGTPPPVSATPTASSAAPATTTTPSASTTPAAAGKISLTVGRESIKAGDSFTVSLIIETPVPSRGAQWQLSFNPQELRYESLAEGDFFKDWARANGGTTFLLPDAAPDDSGNFPNTGIAVMAKQSGGATGRGTLCAYTFTALTDAPGLPMVHDVSLYDDASRSYPAVITDSTGSW